MKLDREKMREIEARETVVLVTTYRPKWDDGYGSWDNRGRNEALVGKTIDDPELDSKINEAIQKILARHDVQLGLQNPLFHLEERKIRAIPIKVGGVEVGIE